MKIKQIILSTAVVLSVFTLVAPVTVGAVDVFQSCTASSDSAVCKDTKNETVGKIVTPIVNTLLFILGAVSVIMIIVAGFRYTTSGGDSGAVTSAKNTLMYAIIGLVVAILALAIVNFVVGAFTAKPTPAPAATAKP